MKNNSLAYWFQGKKGRLIMASLPVIFLIVMGIDFLKSGDLEYYFFILYALILGFLLYKTWGYYYKFAALYRKKINPDFALTNAEIPEFFNSNPGILFQTIGFRQFGLIWKKYKDKELASLASKIQIYAIFLFFSPILWFLLAIVISNLI